MASKKKNGRPTSLSTQILVQIRDEMRRMREELGELKGEIGTTNERLERLERRHAEDSLRLASEVVAVAKAVVEVRDLLRDQRVERGRLDEHEKRLTALESKTA